VTSSASYTLGDNIEALTLENGNIDGTGNALDNVIGGGSGDNLLSGAAGNDTLAGNSGDDTLQGGNGNDVYVLNEADTVVEATDEGIDRVESKVSFTLAENVENLTLTADGSFGNVDATGTGNALDNVILGVVSGDNLLSGLDGNDSLNGRLGDDTLVGGNGNDTYAVNSGNDSVFESADEGIDLVQSKITYELGSNLENLVLLDGAVDGLGNELDNVLAGNAVNNQLFGGNGNDSLEGGAGDDTLLGGDGNDVFVYAATVQGAGDVVAGDADVALDVEAGDVLDITGGLAASLTSNDSVSGSAGLDEGEELGSAINGSNNIAFDDANDLLMIDVSGNGSFDAGTDFSIELVGVATVTYNAGNSTFSFTLDT